MLRKDKYKIVYFILLLTGQIFGQIEIETAFPNLTFLRPVDLQMPIEIQNRFFVLEQAGIIKLFENIPEVSETKIFLDIQDRVNNSGNEEGLLGLAFHPEFNINGYFFVNYTASNPRRTIISRFAVKQNNPDEAEKDSELLLLEIAQPYSNHNGGQIAFGPDGYLYIATGDGGSGGDPLGNGTT
jgi:glucose/arabinose dehydrogenase